MTYNFLKIRMNILIEMKFAGAQISHMQALQFTSFSSSGIENSLLNLEHAA